MYNQAHAKIRKITCNFKIVHYSSLVYHRKKNTLIHKEYIDISRGYSTLGKCLKLSIVNANSTDVIRFVKIVNGRRDDNTRWKTIHMLVIIIVRSPAASLLISYYHKRNES